MSWSEISEEVREILAERLTPRELKLVKLRAAHPGAGNRKLAELLELSTTRVRDIDRSIARKLEDLRPELLARVERKPGR